MFGQTKHTCREKIQQILHSSVDYYEMSHTYPTLKATAVAAALEKMKYELHFPLRSEHDHRSAMLGEK